MKKNNLIFFLLFFIATDYCCAQQPVPYARIEQMHARKWNYLIEQAKLLQKEGDLIQPFFIEYEKAIWSLHEQKRTFFNTVKLDDANVDINYSKLNDQYIDFVLKESTLLKNYHSQLKKNLKPQTLYNYYQAESEFKKHLLHSMRGEKRQNINPPK
jgi:hypothetical protein